MTEQLSRNEFEVITSPHLDGIGVIAPLAYKLINPEHGSLNPEMDYKQNAD